MSLVQVENFLAHFGVKGMKWGVRKDVSIVGRTDLQPGGLGGQGIARSYGKGNPAATDAERNAVLDATMAARAHLLDRKKGPFSPGGEVSKVNDKWRAENPDGFPKARRKEYEAEVEQALTNSAKKILPSGADAKVLMSPNSIELLVGTPNAVKEVGDALRKTMIRHGVDTTVQRLTFDIRRDSDGFITSVSLRTMSEEVANGAGNAA